LRVLDPEVFAAAGFALAELSFGAFAFSSVFAFDWDFVFASEPEERERVVRILRTATS